MYSSSLWREEKPTRDNIVSTDDILVDSDPRLLRQLMAWSQWKEAEWETFTLLSFLSSSVRVAIAFAIEILV